LYCTIALDSKKDFFIICLHLHSKVGIDEATQLILNNKAAQEIHSFLQKNHNRTILVGDFNHNPYEAIMSSKLMFNALPNRELMNCLKHRSSSREGKKSCFIIQCGIL